MLIKIILGISPTFTIIITGASVSLFGIGSFKLFPGRAYIDQAAGFPGLRVDRARLNAGDLAASSPSVAGTPEQDITVLHIVPWSEFTKT